MKWNNLDEEQCSVARAVSVIGDRWSLLILRDCFMRVRRFDDFQQRLGITRHLLSARLKAFVADGILRKVAYQQRPARYEYILTQRGLDLHPIMLALAHWGDLHMGDERGRPLLHRHRQCGHCFDPLMTCSECGEPVKPHDVIVEPGPGAPDGSSHEAHRQTPPPSQARST